MFLRGRANCTTDGFRIHLAYINCIMELPFLFKLCVHLWEHPCTTAIIDCTASQKSTKSQQHHKQRTEPGSVKEMGDEEEKEETGKEELVAWKNKE